MVEAVEKKRSIIGKAAIIAAGTFLAKLLGALYRIPLTNLLGGEGLGLYQMVFPVYCVLLDFAGAGAPSAISKISAPFKEEKDAVMLLKSSLRLLAVLGLIGAVALFIFAKPLATAQGNENAYLGYMFLAPAVFAVSLLSCFRGYFQGRLIMYPTAVSQVIEQGAKLLLGLLFAYLLLPNLPQAVAGATAAVSVAEFFALFILWLTFRKRQKKFGFVYPFEKKAFLPNVKKLIKYTVPITLIGVLIPLSQVADSFLIINILGRYSNNSTALYGLFSGAASSVINLPVALCYGVAAVAIPIISSSLTKNERNKNAVKTLLLTAFMAVFCAAAVYFFAPLAVRVLFNSLSQDEKIITQNLIRVLSLSVIFLSLLQTENAVLIGSGKLIFPIISLLLGIAVKIAIELITLPIENINIYGGAIGVIACYFVVCLLNLIKIVSISKREKKVENKEPLP